MVFTRPEHNIILELLGSMKQDVLRDNKCYFGGGTAIVLSLDEYRQSLDVDFLCADVDGYRELRNGFFGGRGVDFLFPAEVKPLREVRADATSVRLFLEYKEQRIKFEIVREARIELEGAPHRDLIVPTLSVRDMFAEKLLANSDRCYDRSVAYRDAIDLGHLVQAHHGLDRDAIAKAERAYGDDILRKMRGVLNLLVDRKEIRHASEVLDMDYERSVTVIEGLRQAAKAIWPESGIDDDPKAESAADWSY
ncbi:hypothetical protein RvVAT039_07510 [Agrobacterium vitis]|uniref:nucleotidyl transferase AbiEii/AbiGii toxin family protein n=1 Tax=Agrobacterium vitis TaxID=373 RepID=UPI0015DAEFC4|nr:nucleotidyl transferase AbiEii/AbiGii toxin family protein [Agrobacterium vitis]BCH63535.1 hypothetical protein RvVAT039_07510 [Agrobacterium vitis]